MSAPRPALRPLLVPTEHGGWGFALEPGILGILVAPGTASVGLAVFALFAFLADRPARLVLGDLYRRRSLPRTRWAAGVAALYGSVAVAAFAVAVAAAARPFWWVPAAAVPLIAVESVLGARARPRSIVRQIAGPVALASIAAAAPIAAGEAIVPALGLWLILAVRVAVSVTLVRGQIRRIKGKEMRARQVGLVHAAGLTLVAAAAVGGVVSWPAFAAIGGLAGWAVVALASPPVRATVVGASQMIAGLAVVLLAAWGHPPG